MKCKLNYRQKQIVHAACEIQEECLNIIKEEAIDMYISFINNGLSIDKIEIDKKISSQLFQFNKLKRFPNDLLKLDGDNLKLITMAIWDVENLNGLYKNERNNLTYKLYLAGKISQNLN